MSIIVQVIVSVTLIYVIVDNYTTQQALKPASMKTLGVLLCFLSLCQSTCTMVHMWSQKIKISFVRGANSSNIFIILLNSIFLLRIQLSVSMLYPVAYFITLFLRALLFPS